MKNIKVNKFMWDGLGEAGQKQVISHLRIYGVLRLDEGIIGDANMPMPVIAINHQDEDDGTSVSAQGIDWMCRAVCDSSEVKENCVFYGQSTRLCLESIAKSRELLELEGAD